MCNCAGAGFKETVYQVGVMLPVLHDGLKPFINPFILSTLCLTVSCVAFSVLKNLPTKAGRAGMGILGSFSLLGSSWFAFSLATEISNLIPRQAYRGNNQNQAGVERVVEVPLAAE